MSEKPASCVGCPLFPAPGPVPGDGLPSSDGWLIGEAPTATEVVMGKAIAGGAGGLLNDQLARAGRPRGLWYADNIVKCQPPGDRAPTSGEIEHCTRTQLLPLAEAYRPKMIVPLGAAASGVFTGISKIKSIAGYVYTYKSPTTDYSTTIVPVVDPAGVMRTVIAPTVSQTHYRKIVQLLEGKIEVLADPRMIDRTEFAQLLLERKYFTLDIETDARPFFEAGLTCLGVGWKDAVWSLYPPWDLTDLQYLIEALRNPEYAVRGHNIHYDITVLRSMGIEVDGVFEDSIVLHHAGYAELPHALGFVGSLYLTCREWKSMMRGPKGTKETDTK